jgi:uncharacterized protein (TIGR03086 family)
MGVLGAQDPFLGGQRLLIQPDGQPHPAGVLIGGGQVVPQHLARADLMAALDFAALARLVPGPWGPMPLGEILERSAMEFLVHTWDLAHATGQAAVLDPALVRDALGPARQFAPLARSSGLVGPECAVAEDADDLTKAAGDLRPP